MGAGTVLYRLTHVQFPDPAYFGRAALFRFDAAELVDILRQEAHAILALYNGQQG